MKKRSKSLDKAHYVNICNRYASGESMASIARSYGVGICAVRSVLIGNSIKLRGNTSRIYEHLDSKEILERYESEELVSEIAKSFGVGMDTIYSVLRPQGVVSNPGTKKRWGDEGKEEIKKKYKEVGTYQKVGEVYGISKQRVWQIINRGEK